MGLAGTKGISCYWALSFRSEDAVLFFRSAWWEVTNGREDISPSDSNPVNHPDRYHLQELVTEKGTYRVALNDKCQPTRTLVRVGFEYNM